MEHFKKKRDVFLKLAFFMCYLERTISFGAATGCSGPASVNIERSVKGFIVNRTRDIWKHSIQIFRVERKHALVLLLGFLSKKKQNKRLQNNQIEHKEKTGQGI